MHFGIALGSTEQRAEFKSAGATLMRQESQAEWLESIGISTSSLTRNRVLQLWQDLNAIAQNGTPDVCIRNFLQCQGFAPETVGCVMRKLGRTS